MKMTTEPKDDDIEIVHADTPTEVEVVEQPVAAAAPTVEQGIADLQRQLESERAARAIAEQRANTAQVEAGQFKTQAEQSQYTAISRALDAANGAAESAEARYVTAMEAGDYKAAAKAQSEMARIAAQQTQLEAGKSQMEAMRNSPQYRQPQQQQRVDPNSFEGRISNATPRTQQWLRAHPEAVTDPEKNAEALLAHQRAVKAGHAPDSDAYFSYVEQVMGYQPAPQAKQRQANQSAPVTQQSRQPAGQQTKTTFTMTPKMRELAAMSGVPEATWAKQYLAGLKDGSQEPIH
jgi:hypothetical protein